MGSPFFFVYIRIIVHFILCSRGEWVGYIHEIRGVTRVVRSPSKA